MILLRFAIFSLSLLIILSACTSETVDDPGADTRASSTSASDSGQVMQATTIVEPLEIVRILSSDAMQGRLTGTTGNGFARDWLKKQLIARNLQPLLDDYEQPFEFTSVRDGKKYKGVNLLARIPGAASDGRSMVVTAHYDHVGTNANGEIFNGADDNADSFLLSRAAILKAGGAGLVASAPAP